VDTPQIDDFIVWAGAVFGAIVVIAAAVAGLHRLVLRGVNTRLDQIDGQLRKNSGTSLRDAVDRIEERQQLIGADMRRVTERLDDHITYHLEEKK
jgi:hypothetical protein